MRRRLQVARGMVNEPRVMVLDEPTTGLDPEARRVLWAVLAEERRRGVAILLSTHYMEEAERLCDRVAIIHLGRIVTVGDPRVLIDGEMGTTKIREVIRPGYPIERAPNMEDVYLKLTGALLLIPLSFVFAAIFSSLGLWVSARAKTIESISYPQYLLVFPMFLFCGVFYPLTQLPRAVQTAAWFLPLTPVLSLIRTLALGFPFDIKAPVLVFAWLAVLVPTARRAMIKRLVH
jgi:hypothetical protein